MSGVGFLYPGGLWGFLLWGFYPVGGVRQLACQGFLVREACVSVLVRGIGFLLSGVQWSVQFSSLWSAVECPVMSFAMGLCVRCDFGQPVC